ncbi:MAG: A/G-specific adenine glycosylase [Planctomycetota bacterium]|nr:A/G-specific adenine glycosylase [Planctomycetota bacterium]
MDAEFKRRFRRQLRRWYKQHARVLPWRSSPTPYRVWISEIMLQQTQVSKVIPYFEHFVERFPDVQSLAAASEQDVLRCWEGLGYYRRARQLHRAAHQICDQHGGVIPGNPAALQDLPGIGRYSSGAILSIAFEKRLPILEANTIRLLSRLFAIDQDIHLSSTQGQLWELAEELLPRKHIGDFNQALMELGGQVCSPRQPACNECPLRLSCQARQHGLEQLLPFNPRKVNYESVHEAAVIIKDSNGKVLLRHCGDDERWAGMWDYPRFSLDVASSPDRIQEQLEKGVQTLTDVQIGRAEPLVMLEHSVTRFRITLHCYRTSELTPSSHQSECRQDLCWLSPEELESYPLSSMGRTISEQLL